MAKGSSNQRNQVRDPMKTKTGKPRLGPLSLKQLADMLEKTSRPKDKSKIQNRINELNRRGQAQ